jgi:hypothetical protein
LAVDMRALNAVERRLKVASTFVAPAREITAQAS